MTNNFLDALAKRRTYYNLDKNITVPPERVQDILERTLLYTPSAFNSQSARAVLLWGEQHDQLWGIVKETLRAIVAPDAFAKTGQKIDSFAAAGTVLYFDDTEITASLQEKFPIYRENFPIWAQQANAMLQSNVWVALTLEGLGASLQHYNPLIDEAVKARWNIPASWQLIAQMPFGNPTAEPGAKDTLPAAQRMRSFV